MIFGYARVSTQDQNLDLQLDALNKFGCDEIFNEKMTGTKKERPQLEEMMKKLRKGDKVVIFKLDRISRSTKHLIELSETFADIEVDFISLQDNIDTSSPIGRFFFKIMACVAEFERDITVERTKAGLQSARARGRKGGRPKKDKSKIELAIKMYQSKDYSIGQIEDATGVSKTTLYRYLN